MTVNYKEKGAVLINFKVSLLMYHPCVGDHENDQTLMAITSQSSRVSGAW
jgi:hypothetical protein